MIPKFPAFKEIKLEDKKEIENFTGGYHPYSDFNFTSLWLWDIDYKMKISQLNENLVVLFYDYVSSKPFISFIGENMIPETALELIEFSKKELATDSLKLIPEEVAKKMDSKFEVNFDKDSHDYIYHIPDLANMNTLQDKDFRKGMRQFIRMHPNYKLKEFNIQDAPKEECSELFSRWASNKKIKDYLNIREYKAFQKLFEIEDGNIKVICLYVKEVLVGFTVYEILPNNFAISHFAKGDVSFHSVVNDIINWEEAKNLESKGIKNFNWEQDLGIEGLRKSKEKYRPSLFLEKFTVKAQKNNIYKKSVYDYCRRSFYFFKKIMYLT